MLHKNSAACLSAETAGQPRRRLTISTKPAPLFFIVGASMVVWSAARRLVTARSGAETTCITATARGSSRRHLRGRRETAECWRSVLDDPVARCLRRRELLIVDSAQGLDAAIARIWDAAGLAGTFHQAAQPAD